MIIENWVTHLLCSWALFMWSHSASRVGGIFSTILLFLEDNWRLHWLTPVQILALSYNKIINRTITSWSPSLINCNDDALQRRIGLSFRKIVKCEIGYMIKKFWYFDNRNNHFNKVGFLSKRSRNVFDFEVRCCFRWSLLSQVWNLSQESLYYIINK